MRNYSKPNWVEDCVPQSYSRTLVQAWNLIGLFAMLNLLPHWDAFASSEIFTECQALHSVRDILIPINVTFSICPSRQNLHHFLRETRTIKGIKYAPHCALQEGKNGSGANTLAAIDKPSFQYRYYDCLFSSLT